MVYPTEIKMKRLQIQNLFNEFDTIIYTGTDNVVNNISWLSENFKTALIEYVDEVFNCNY